MGPDLHPFRIDVQQSQVDDLQLRLNRARWPQEVPSTGHERGLTSDRVAYLVDRWRTTYDWRAHEQALNRWPQFVTEIDGQNV